MSQRLSISILLLTLLPAFAAQEETASHSCDAALSLDSVSIAEQAMLLAVRGNRCLRLGALAASRMLLERALNLWQTMPGSEQSCHFEHYLA